MRSVHLVLPAMLLLSGCQEVQLRERTNFQASTVTDLYYEQVLSNLAQLYDAPAALPYFAVPGTGLTNIQRTVSANYQLNWSLITNGAARYVGRYLFDKQSSTAAASQAATEQWTTASTLNPEELLLMQCAYRRALGACDPDCESKLSSYFRSRPTRLAALRPGWFCVGQKKDTPKHVCYVGRYRHTYVWVTADGLEGLSQFTLAILDIATALSPALSDPQVAYVKALQDKAKALADIYDKIPDKKSNQAMELKPYLDAALDALNAALAGKGVETYFESLHANYLTDEGLRTRAERAKSLERELKAADLTPAIPRKSFFNPYAVPANVPVP